MVKDLRLFCVAFFRIVYVLSDCEYYGTIKYPTEVHPTCLKLINTDLTVFSLIDFVPLGF